ncbi:MAG: AMP-binding protein [bacterium]|nr:AMP-binding protein [bacterium]
MQMSFGRAFGWLSEQAPDFEAIVFEDRSATRAELERRSNRLARAYREMGVKEGDLVTIALPNSIEFFEVVLAVWKLGATPSPISSYLPEIERRAIIETTNPALLIGAQPGEQSARVSLVAGFEPDTALSDAILPEVTPECARAMTSGGSTGRPKVIVEKTPGVTDPEVAENGMRVGGTTLVPGPLYHAGPFITSWQTLFSGGRIVLMPRFEPEACLRRIEEQGVSWVLFVPTMMQRIWKLPDEVRARYDLSSLEVVMSSGAASPDWLKRAWIDWLGPEKIMEAYGGSERIGGTLISGSEWLEHPGSVGKPTAGRKVRILDSAGKDVPTGEIGEVYMMPPGGQGSTYRYIGAQARSTDDGWETLGDMGYLDEDGYLYLADRKTDMIVTGGANVYPAEVEAAIDAYPTVRSSAVIGLPEEDLGLAVHAIVDAPDGVTDDQLRAHLSEHLVRYKIPRSFEYVKQPLRDDAGKVRRSALREARIREAQESD